MCVVLVAVEFIMQFDRYFIGKRLSGFRAQNSLTRGGFGMTPAALAHATGHDAKASHRRPLLPDQSTRPKQNRFNVIDFGSSFF